MLMVPRSDHKKPPLMKANKVKKLSLVCIERRKSIEGIVGT